MRYFVKGLVFDECFSVTFLFFHIVVLCRFLTPVLSHDQSAAPLVGIGIGRRGHAISLFLAHDASIGADAILECSCWRTL